MSLLFLHNVSSVPADCLDMATLAQGLNVDPSIISQIQTNCCTVTGIECDANSRVVKLQWTDKGLNGVILPGSIPPLLSFINLSNNDIYGTIQYLPNTITTLILSKNMISGPMPSSFSSNMVLLDLSDNRLTGTVPSFPPALQTLNLATNTLSGTVYLSQPTVFDIHINQITYISVTDNEELTNCDYSNNPLLGVSLPSLPTFCPHNNLFAPPVVTTPLTKTTTRSTSTLKSTRSTVSSIKMVFTTPTSALYVTTKTSVAILKTASATLSATFKATSKSFTSPSGMSASDKSILSQPSVLSANMLDQSSSSAFLQLFSSAIPSNNPSTSADFLSAPFEYSIFDSTSTSKYLFPERNFIFNVEHESTQLTTEKQSLKDSNIDMVLLYGLAGAFIGLCILVFVASKVFKSPKLHSKFGRRTSFSTLNTVTTKATQQT